MRIVVRSAPANLRNVIRRRLALLGLLIVCACDLAFVQQCADREACKPGEAVAVYDIMGQEHFISCPSVGYYYPSQLPSAFRVPLSAPETGSLTSDELYLIAGGVQSYPNAELFDPSAGTFTAAGSLGVNRIGATSTLLKDGEILIAGGQQVPDDQISSYAELYDSASNTFAPAGSMLAPRFGHTATLLPNGKVLLAGGVDDPRTNQNTAIDELYDPVAKKFTCANGSAPPCPASASLIQKRAWQTATLLTGGAQAGKVLFTGGQSFTDFSGVTVKSAELYDWQSGDFICTNGKPPTGTPPACPASTNMISARDNHQATELTTGLHAGDVLLSGGENVPIMYLVTVNNTAELYDPTLGKFICTDGSTPTGTPPACPTATQMAVARERHTATRLESGMVLLAGGQSNLGGTASAEIFDPATGTFKATASNPSKCPFSPTSSPPAGCMFDALFGHTATLLADGRVLIANGFENQQFIPPTLTQFFFLPFGGTQGVPGLAQFFNPSNNTFSLVGSTLAQRSLSTATTLTNGKILLAGGTALHGGMNYNGEIYDATTSKSDLTGNMQEGRYLNSATLLPNKQAVFIAGTNILGTSLTAETYDPNTGQFLYALQNFCSNPQTMIVSRTGHTATLLTSGPQSGKILLLGGLSNANGITAQNELYDPVAQTFTCIDGTAPNGSPPACRPATNMITSRANHTATLLENGKILIAGGVGLNPAGNTSVLNTAEIYDPVAHKFSCVNGSAPGGSPPACPASTNMIFERTGHTATLLTSGRVLIAGGLDVVFNKGTGKTLNSAEVFDSVQGRFLCPNGSAPNSSAPFCPAATQLINDRIAHSATLLQNGEVLIAGGMTGNGTYNTGGKFVSRNTAELFDPSHGAFTCTNGSAPTGTPPACPSTTAMTASRAGHAAALRSDGKVILSGGLSGVVQALPGDPADHDPVHGQTLNSIESFDPATGKFSPAGNMVVPRAGHTMLATSAPKPVYLAPEAVNCFQYPIKSANNPETCAILILTNNQSTALMISGASIAGTDTKDFSLANNFCGSTLAAGKSCALVVNFIPQATGQRSATLMVTDNAAGSPQTSALSGVGILPVAFTPSTLSFSSQKVGTASNSKTVTMTNQEPNCAVPNAPLNIKSITIGGLDKADFAQTNTCPSTLDQFTPSCTISVTFKPTATGTRTAQVVIVDNANTSPQSVPLTGDGS